MKVIYASEEGQIIEYSQKDEDYFCMTVFDNVKLLCTLKSKTPPKIGQKAKFLNHQRTKQGQIFEIELVWVIAELLPSFEHDFVI